jgi:hypothetical protein
LVWKQLLHPQDHRLRLEAQQEEGVAKGLEACKGFVLLAWVVEEVEEGIDSCLWMAVVGLVVYKVIILC